MQQFQPVLLRVWRAACRQTQIEESTAGIAALLTDDLPLDRVTVRRIDSERSCLESVAGCAIHGGQDLEPGRTDCGAATLRRLLAWCRRGEVLQLAAGSRPPGWWAGLLETSPTSERLIGPLVAEGQPIGLVVLTAPAGVSWRERQRTLVQVLLEPLAVALENDGRLREMTRLKEAAEAERRSLLTKLGREQLDEAIVGLETGLQAVMQRVAQVAGSDVPVLLFGETGTGKEVIARAIHRRSHRAAGPILRVNCGAIPAELIDSELFGHERGAFTGAVDLRPGWFERADGGTLFLDEIGELSLAAQVRLLRIVQDGWLDRVGGRQPISVDVRIIAATHRDLPAMVAEGTFREDLWYRLAVFPIVLPPLRERREDIPALARHFAQRATRRFGLAFVEPAPADLELLRAYPWPGNIRELGSVIDRAAILGEGRTLEVARALGVLAPPARSAAPAAGRAMAARAAADGSATLDEVMKQHIETVLAATGGRIEGPAGAAIRLGINPHTLRARMRKLGIKWRSFRR